MSHLFVVMKTSIVIIVVYTLAYLLFACVESHHFPVTYTAVNLVMPTETVVTTSPLAPAPISLTIPSIGVLAKVQPVGLASDGSGEMAPPSNFVDVAWYKDGTVPGMNGNAVIAGHLSGKKVPEAVFYDLKKLVLGDEILVTDESGATLTFKVTAVKSFKHTDPADEVFLGDSTAARLNLITCAGTWLPGVSLFEERIVIFSELVTTE
ncbi:MAG: peptidase C60 sortase A and B [Parcubacteria group bacterium GW2011_GWF2_44_8]|nr:MAG: peptidase C60 sortase A and B [Parcubacteria group bacterium GW2011_GWF2_44_8]